MDNLLREISSARIEPTLDGKPRSEDLIQISSQSRIGRQDALPAISEAIVGPTKSALSPTTTTDKPTIIDRLRATPSLTEVLIILEDIRQNDELNPRFAPPAQSSPVLRVLLEHTIPNFWPLVATQEDVGRDKERKSLRNLLLHFFETPVGLSSIIARLRALNATPKTSENEVSMGEAVKQILGLLQTSLGNENALRGLWNEARGNEGVRVGMVWREVVALLAGGKVLSLAAEARKKFNLGGEEELWISEGSAYARWLGKSISIAVEKADEDDREALKAFGQILGKSLSLGYSNDIIDSFMDISIARQPTNPTRLSTFLSYLQTFEKRNFLLTLLRVLSKQFLSDGSFSPSSPYTDGWWKKDAENIGAVSKLISEILIEELGVEDFQQALLEWINSHGGVGDSIGIRRAVLLAVASLKRKDLVQDIFQKSLNSFADKLWMKHTPILRQEATTQILLLTTGLLHRLSPTYLKSQTQSSLYLNAITNRLGAHSNRARVLGAFVGETISGLVDEEKNRLKFGIPDTGGDEVKWWGSIVRVEDKLADDLSALQKKLEESAPKSQSSSSITKIMRKPKPKPTTPSTPLKKLIALIDSDDEEEDDLKPYAAPSDDEPDSDEDPTTINRKKPSPPVYIRDLLTYIRTDNYDNHFLALTHAAPLILRKSAFGTEVIDALPDLIPAFLGVTDQFEIENFEELRQGALIALVRAAPETSGPKMARLFYEGDLSISQKLGLLSALTLGARALAGYEDTEITQIGTGAAPSFPSKMLPERLHAVYAVDGLGKGLQGEMLRPLAVKASEELAGPKVLQVSKVSRRLELQRTRRFVPKPASRLAKCVGEAFLFPLIGLWWRFTRDFAPSLPYPLTSTYLKTVFLILHAAGPSTASLPQLTREALDFLALFRRPLSSPTSTEGHTSALDLLDAVFFGYLTLLEIHAEAGDDGKGFVRQYGREVNEAAEWARGCFENLNEEGEEGDVKKVAAGLILRWGEMVEGLDVLQFGWESSGY